MRRDPGLWCSVLLTTTLLAGCGVLGSDASDGKSIELAAVLTGPGGKPLFQVFQALKASRCGGSDCLIVVRPPVDMAALPQVMVSPAAGPVPGVPCVSLSNDSFTAATCSDGAGSVGFALCLPGPGDTAFAWTPCAATEALWMGPDYLEAILMMGPALSALAGEAPATADAPEPVVAGSWPAGPAKVCVAMTPESGVDLFSFAVTINGGIAPVRVQGPSGITNQPSSNPACVLVEVPQSGGASIVIRVNANVMKSASDWDSVSCTYTYVNPAQKPVVRCAGGAALPSTLIVGPPGEIDQQISQIAATLAVIGGVPSA
ncbi:MAG: hypothetical protein IPL40_11970 [Proteobacteria bacterium]|nr:hypothetical protein [Pseudomonadota bacterium]